MELFRIEDGAIIAGSLKERIERNEFLRTDRNYENFELHTPEEVVASLGAI